MRCLPGSATAGQHKGTCVTCVAGVAAKCRELAAVPRGRCLLALQQQRSQCRKAQPGCMHVCEEAALSFSIFCCVRPLCKCLLPTCTYRRFSCTLHSETTHTKHFPHLQQLKLPQTWQGPQQQAIPGEVQGFEVDQIRV